MSTTFAAHFLEGTHAGRPAASSVPEGSLYSCEDHILVYQSDGTAWSVWANMDAVGGLKGSGRNESGGTLAAGTPVYISGYSVGFDVILFDAADATTDATLPCIGVLESDVPNNDFGVIVFSGIVEGIDLSAFTAGDEVWVSTTAGALTSTAPTGNARVQAVGKVLRAHATEGILDVDRSNPILRGYENARVSLVVPNTAAGTYTLEADDADTYQRFTDANAMTVTVPDNATVPFAVGTVIDVFAAGAGGLTLSPAAGVALSGQTTLAEDEYRRLVKVATDSWDLLGSAATSGGGGGGTPVPSWERLYVDFTTPFDETDLTGAPAAIGTTKPVTPTISHTLTAGDLPSCNVADFLFRPVVYFYGAVRNPTNGTGTLNVELWVDGVQVGTNPADSIGTTTETHAFTAFVEEASAGQLVEIYVWTSNAASELEWHGRWGLPLRLGRARAAESEQVYLWRNLNTIRMVPNSPLVKAPLTLPPRDANAADWDRVSNDVILENEPSFRLAVAGLTAVEGREFGWSLSEYNDPDSHQPRNNVDAQDSDTHTSLRTPGQMPLEFTVDRYAIDPAADWETVTASYTLPAPVETDLTGAPQAIPSQRSTPAITLTVTNAMMPTLSAGSELPHSNALVFHGAVVNPTNGTGTLNVDVVVNGRSRSNVVPSDGTGQTTETHAFTAVVHEIEAGDVIELYIWTSNAASQLEWWAHHTVIDRHFRRIDPTDALYLYRNFVVTTMASTPSYVTALTRPVSFNTSDLWDAWYDGSNVLQSTPYPAQGDGWDTERILAPFHRYGIVRSEHYDDQLPNEEAWLYDDASNTVLYHSNTPINFSVAGIAVPEMWARVLGTI